MPEITAKLVNELRAKTGQGMMECKKMLTEALGDIEKAIDLFRKKGVKASLTERAASEGRVAGAVSSDGKTAAVVEINCNTDFTAKSEPVHAAAKKAAQFLAANPTGDVSSSVGSDLVTTAQKTGENVRLGKTGVVSSPHGKTGFYLYSITGKIGVV
ncbi:MAG: translation elongation factor Ts, partial [Tepidisphaeraceae bacterium]